jgi:hypothetical protein
MNTHLTPIGRVAGVLALALAALATPAVAAAAADRAGDQQIADDSVLTLDDVPQGFEETTADDTPDAPAGAACRGIRGASKALNAVPHTEVQFESPDRSSGGALINNQVSIFTTPARAKAAYAPYAAKNAKTCLETEYERIFLRQLDDPTAKVDAKATRFVPGFGDASVGYKVTIHASAKGDAETFYVEVEVARASRGVNAFGFFNTGSAPPSEDVQSMTDIGMQQLEAAL